MNRHIFVLTGKSSTGKDRMYRELLADETLGLRRVVLYTTRPMRAGEEEGRQYHFIDEDAYRKLKPCTMCAAPARKETIRTINQAYAEGGDHDPVMTEARKNCPRKLKGK